MDAIKYINTGRLALILWSLRVSMNNTDDTSRIDKEVAEFVDEIEGELKQRGHDPDRVVDLWESTRNLKQIEI